MTVDELWEDAKALLKKELNPSGQLKDTLHRLAKTPQGRSRLVRELDQPLATKPKLLRCFAQIMEPSGELSSSLGQQERIELLRSLAQAASSDHAIDVTYWIFLWLQLKSGELTAPNDIANGLKSLNKGGQSPNDLYVRFTSMHGWGTFSRDRWIELVEEAWLEESSADFQECLQRLVELIRATGGKSTRAPVAATTSVPGLPKAATSAEANLPQGTQTQATGNTATPLEKSSTPPPAEVRPESSVKAAGGTATPLEKSPTPATPVVRPEPSEGKQPQPRDRATESGATPLEKSTTPPPAEVRPESRVEAAGDTATQLEKSSTSASPEVRPESSEGKQPKPRRAASPRKPGKQVASPSETGPEGDSGASSDPGPTESSRSGRTGIPSPEFGGEIAAALADIASAIRSISERIDEMVGRTSEQASQGEKLNVLERRVAELGRVLSEAPADARRSREEVEKLQLRIQEQEEDLRDARRERDESAARVEDLARRLASSAPRIEAAERRADQNIHEAFRERDAAVLTFKAKLWDAIQAQLADVTDPTHGERFANTEEEVLTTRLRTIRNILRAEGIPP